MSIEIQNKLNIWKLKEYSRWYRIDQKISLFFRKIKWTWQRAKYGYCDRDLWNLDYTLGNYIANTTNKLADITWSHPHGITYEEWQGVLRSIARNFYLGTNEDCYDNPYEDMWFRFETEDGSFDAAARKAELWNEFVRVEKENHATMNICRQEGFNLLQKWFTHLWD